MKKLIFLILCFLSVNLYSNKKIVFNGVYEQGIHTDFVFVKRNTNIREKPTTNSKKIGYSTPFNKFKYVSEIKNQDNRDWYEIEYNGNLAYIYSKNAIKRKFAINEAIDELEKFNDFIKKNKNKLAIIKNYTPLDNTKGTSDRFNNSENQSIPAYIKDEKYNIPDGSILARVGQDDNNIYLTSDIYEDVLSVDKQFKKNIKNIKLQSITKIIYIDKKSQTQVSVEKTKDGYNVVAMGYITTGIESESSFSTPYGNFLVAITKPKMLYTELESEEIVGDANYAIRFSGGAYLHGIPSKYEPEETRQERKDKTEQKLGTYPLSMKCVRNKDEIIKYMYDWIGARSIDADGFRTPKVPVLVVVR